MPKPIIKYICENCGKGSSTAGYYSAYDMVKDREKKMQELNNYNNNNNIDSDSDSDVSVDTEDLMSSHDEEEFTGDYFTDEEYSD